MVQLKAKHGAVGAAVAHVARAHRLVEREARPACGDGGGEAALLIEAGGAAVFRLIERLIAEGVE